MALYAITSCIGPPRAEHVFADGQRRRGQVVYGQDIDLSNAVPELELLIVSHWHTDLCEGRYPARVLRVDGSKCPVVTAAMFGRQLKRTPCLLRIITLARGKVRLVKNR